MSHRRTPDNAAHLPSLDGLRAISFLLVFLAHAGVPDVPGGFGVTIFFFLSGYLITTRLRLEHEARGEVSLKQFYLRRALRILPPFYLVLVLAGLAAWLGVVPGGVRGRAVLAQVLHLSNYWVVRFGCAGQPGGTGVFWSLAVEEHFYLVFPCVYVLLCRCMPEPRRQALSLHLVCALVLVWRVVLVFGLRAGEARTYMGSDTRVDSILFGCALALSGNPALDGPPRLGDAVWRRVLLPTGLLLLLATFVFRAPAFRESVRYTIQGIALVPVFVVALRWPAWGPFRILNFRALTFLGILSYPLYLVHYVLLSAFEAVPGAPRGALVLALSVGVAWAIHELVEKPCARLRRRVERGSVGVSERVEPALAEAQGP